jgi:hypothetical protein
MVVLQLDLWHDDVLLALGQLKLQLRQVRHDLLGDLHLLGLGLGLSILLLLVGIEQWKDGVFNVSRGKLEDSEVLTNEA